MLKAIASTIAVAALTFGLGTPARASMSDHHTRFTFSQPIALPGVTLPAGTYVFRLADPTIDRKVVQVLDATGRRSYALLHSVPTYRADASNESAVSLMETREGMPAAIKTWWPFGENVGFEFVYPEEQYLRLTGNGTASSTIAGSGLPVDNSGAAKVKAARTLKRAPVDAPLLPVVAVNESPDSGPAFPSNASPLPLVAVLGALTLFGAAWALGKSKRA